MTTTLRELSRKELVRPARQSSMAGEAEYAFWHILARDVAYNQLPRASRAHRHVAAANWIESKAPERVEDLADVLAYHYATALDLAQAAGQTQQAAELEAPALRFLGLAGERALGLDMAAARVSLRHALELAPVGQPGRARLLTLLADAENDSGDQAEAIGLYEEAIALYEAAADPAAAGKATLGLAGAFFSTGQFSRSETLVKEVTGRLEAEQPSEALALAYARRQFFEPAESWSDRALDLAERLDLPSVRIRALNMRGIARSNLGDPRAIEDLRKALGLALQVQNTFSVNSVYTNLVWALKNEDPAAAVRVAEEGIAFATTRGNPLPGVAANRQWPLVSLGRWDEVLDHGRKLIEHAKPLGDRWLAGYAASPMVRVLVRRGGSRASNRAL